ncbi:MAG: hypothetical protein ACOX6U_05055 [Oscillospiraceae bacterium]|jgi:hypothetical protein
MNTPQHWPTWEELPAIKAMPDVTIDKDGKPITNLDQWETQRAYLKEMFAHYMYGHIPQERGKVTANVAEKRLKFQGKAVNEHIILTFGDAKKIPLHVRFIYPNQPQKRFPVIIRSCDNIWEEIPLEEKALTEYGFALAAFNRCDLCADRTMREMLAQYRRGELTDGAPSTMEAMKKMDVLTPADEDLEHISSAVTEAYPGYDWGQTAQWGFGYSIVTDYLETLLFIDRQKICFTGHSRLGKAALCAGIYDDRAAVVTPNGSGCGGVGSFRFLGGHDGLQQDPTKCEAIGGIMGFAPEWWCPEFANFGDNAIFPKREEHLPFDANTLRASIAPRACFSTEGLSDNWSNPCGTQYAWEDAQPLFDALGIPERNGIHYREGGHAHNEADWQALLTYLNFYYFGKPLTEDINQKRFTR